jgi:esterase/lipase superfamily enzyme
MGASSSASDWERWFAWYPVKVDGRHYWLCTVERRHVRVTIGARLLGSSIKREFWNYRLSYEGTELAKQLNAWKRELKDLRTSFYTPPKLEGAKDLQEVMFTTTRLVLDNEDFSEHAITDVRSESQTFGRAWVSIPGRHKIGNVERPSFNWRDLTVEEESARQHFLLLDLSRMTDDEFFRDLGSSSHDSVLLFVHGYNTSFKEAVFKTAQMAFDANFYGKVIAYSWPSKALVAGYDYDRESAIASARPLLMLVHQIRISKKNLYIVAHSLGSQIVIDALQMASLSGDDLNLHEVVFAAPDVDRDVFSSRADLIKKVAGGITLYASSADKALQVSRTKAGGVARAGDMAEAAPLLIDGIDLIDVTVLGEDMFALNHGIFASNRSVLDDLGRIVTSRTRPPHVRTPTLQRMPDRLSTKYWMYPR